VLQFSHFVKRPLPSSWLSLRRPAEFPEPPSCADAQIAAAFLVHCALCVRIPRGSCAGVLLPSSVLAQSGFPFVIFFPQWPSWLLLFGVPGIMCAHGHGAPSLVSDSPLLVVGQLNVGLLRFGAAGGLPRAISPFVGSHTCGLLLFVRPCIGLQSPFVTLAYVFTAPCLLHVGLFATVLPLAGLLCSEIRANVLSWLIRVAEPSPIRFMPWSSFVLKFVVLLILGQAFSQCLTVVCVSFFQGLLFLSRAWWLVCLRHRRLGEPCTLRGSGVCYALMD
jgi:hypothetical protein